MRSKWIIIVVMVLLIAGGVWWYIGVREQPTTELTPEQKDEVAARNRTVPAAQQNDEDQDGLVKEQETALGTSDLEIDSDADGLTDRAELETWKTDPTKTDTDGDGFADLAEITNGYNPNGSGMLVTGNPT